jgi:N-acetylmuramic acid 6-phosphate (MurNAc-6-P) etherase
MRFKIGLDGLVHRVLQNGDSAIGVLSEVEKDSLLSPGGFYHVQLEAARKAGAEIGLVFFGREKSFGKIKAQQSVATTYKFTFVSVPETDLLLDGVTRVGVKLVMNALSTCTMVRLGRVMGNTMIWVVASNLKLIDRATRYIERLTGLTYAQANHLLFEVIEYVEPRMKADQAYPPVVGMAAMRARHDLTNAQAEERLNKEISS